MNYTKDRVASVNTGQVAVRELCEDWLELHAEITRLQAIVDGYTAGAAIGDALMDKLIEMADKTKARLQEELRHRVSRPGEPHA